jgi:hypothetical protein
MSVLYESDSVIIKNYDWCVIEHDKSIGILCKAECENKITSDIWNAGTVTAYAFKDIINLEQEIENILEEDLINFIELSASQNLK